MFRSKWLLAGLVLSVVVNVALIGVVIGQRYGHSLPPMFAAKPMFGVMRWSHTLPEARREALAETFAGYRAQARPDFRAMRQKQRALRAAMTAEPFDPQAVRAALGALRAGMEAHQARGETALVALLSELSAQERQALDDFLSEHRGRRRP